MKFSLVSSLALVASASAFAPVQQASVSTPALSASSDGIWDPLGLYTLGNGEAFDTFPNMFPNEQFLVEAETKHCRMAMLAWTGVWATSKVSSCKQNRGSAKIRRGQNRACVLVPLLLCVLLSAVSSRINTNAAYFTQHSIIRIRWVLDFTSMVSRRLNGAKLLECLRKNSPPGSAEFLHSL